VATEARIGSTLQPLMLGWHLIFIVSCPRFASRCRLVPIRERRDNWNDYLSRYVTGATSRWRTSTATGPDKEIYIWETSDSAKLRCCVSMPMREIEISSDPKIATSTSSPASKIVKSFVGLRAWEFPDSSPDQRSSRNGRVALASAERSDIMTGWQFD